LPLGTNEIPEAAAPHPDPDCRVFLVDLHTLQIWMRRLNERGERDLALRRTTWKCQSGDGVALATSS
jgi:hypothetical protein